MDGAEDVEQAMPSCRPCSYSQVKACMLERRAERIVSHSKVFQFYFLCLRKDELSE